MLAFQSRQTRTLQPQPSPNKTTSQAPELRQPIIQARNGRGGGVGVGAAITTYPTGLPSKMLFKTNFDFQFHQSLCPSFNLHVQTWELLNASSLKPTMQTFISHLWLKSDNNEHCTLGIHTVPAWSSLFCLNTGKNHHLQFSHHHAYGLPHMKRQSFGSFQLSHHSPCSVDYVISMLNCICWQIQGYS